MIRGARIILKFWQIFISPQWRWGLGESCNIDIVLSAACSLLRVTNKNFGFFFIVFHQAYSFFLRTRSSTFIWMLIILDHIPHNLQYAKTERKRCFVYFSPQNLVQTKTQSLQHFMEIWIICISLTAVLTRCFSCLFCRYEFLGSIQKILISASFSLATLRKSINIVRISKFLMDQRGVFVLRRVRNVYCLKESGYKIWNGTPTTCSKILFSSAALASFVILLVKNLCLLKNSLYRIFKIAKYNFSSSFCSVYNSKIRSLKSQGRSIRTYGA